MDENFSVELISNVKTDRVLDRKNLIGNFVSVLSRKLIFNDEWEVALTEISYTKSWYNIFEDQKVMLIDSFSKIYDCEEKVEKGNYEIEELVTKINEIFLAFTIKTPDIKNCPILIYNKQTNKIAIRLGESDIPTSALVFPHFEYFLSNLLGLIDEQGNQYPHSDDFKFITKFDEILKYEDTNLGIGQISENHDKNAHQNQSIQTVDTKSNVTQDIVKQDTLATQDLTTQTLVQTAERTSKQTQAQTPAKTQTESQTQTQTQEQEKTQKSAEKAVQAPAPIPAQISAQNPVLTSALTPQQTKAQIDGEQKRKDAQKGKAKKRKYPPLDDRKKRSAPYTRSELDDLRKYYENVHYVEGFNSVTLYGTIKSLFVYCDIIKPNLVGDTEVPLIRRVEIPSEKKFGHQIEIIYTRPEYFPLVSHEINSIEIEIKDDANRKVDFAFGRVYLKLHFRKRQDARKSLYNLLF